MAFCAFWVSTRQGKRPFSGKTLPRCRAECTQGTFGVNAARLLSFYKCLYLFSRERSSNYCWLITYRLLPTLPHKRLKQRNPLLLPGLNGLLRMELNGPNTGRLIRLNNAIGRPSRHPHPRSRLFHRLVMIGVHPKGIRPKKPPKDTLPLNPDGIT